MSGFDDPSLARQRTSLAWQRTAAAFAAVTVLLSVAALRPGAPWLVAPAVAVPGAAALMCGLAGTSHRPVRGIALAALATATIAVVATRFQ
jgi:uncharacterized membrane protein YidH (DUF202 family)